MPYKTINDLPIKVRHVLPEHAQHIFMEAFNSAYASSKETDHMRKEVMCFRIAWGATKKSYEKKNGKWVKKKSSEHTE
jgi:cation transport regulator